MIVDRRRRPATEEIDDEGLDVLSTQVPEVVGHPLRLEEGVELDDRLAVGLDRPLRLAFGPQRAEEARQVDSDTVGRFNRGGCGLIHG